MRKTDNAVFDALIASVLRRYDEVVRQNTTSGYDAIRAVAFDKDGLHGVQGEILDVAESVGAPIDDQPFLDALWDAAEQYQARLRDEVAARVSTSTAIAATEPELNAAEAIAAEIRESSAPDFVAFHELCDANMVLHEHMAAQGLDALADLSAANRVTATVDLLLVSGIDTQDDSGEPLRCDDCGRRMAYDHEQEAYRHLVDPERACFLIRSELDTDTQVRSEAVTARFDRLEQPTVDPQEPGPPGGSGIEL